MFTSSTTSSCLCSATDEELTSASLQITPSGSTSTSNLSLLSVSIAWAAGRKADPWTRGKAKELAKVVAMSLLAIVEASEVEEGEGKRAGKRPDFNCKVVKDHGFHLRMRWK